jgi:hypothetical protein
VKDELMTKSVWSGSDRARMSAVSKRIYISGGVDSPADFVDHGFISTPVRSSCSSCRVPIPQPPQHATAAAADVENRYRPPSRENWPWRALARAEWDGKQTSNIDTLKIAQIAIEFLKGSWLGVHEFGRRAASAEILSGHESPVRCFR